MKPEVHFRPKISFAIHRVVPGRSKYLHVAIRLFEELGGRVQGWSVSISGGAAKVVVRGSNGKAYRESTYKEASDADVARTIVLAVKQLLQDMEGAQLE
jgi:hypothetical protein